ncbi:MAG: hypothetical protein QM773_12295 [Hyphomonadaceae bacterium]
MRLRRVIFTAIAAAFLSEAAIAGTTTIYQPSTISKTQSGYSETQIDVNRLRIVFAGEFGTDRETVEANLLYRASEATIQRGFDYFIVVNHSVDTQTQTQRKGPPLPPIGPGKKSQEVARHTAASEILMFKGARPADKPEAYDARITQTNLQWRIVRR